MQRLESPESGELITGGEDRISRVVDADGRILAELAARNFAVSWVPSLLSAKL
jgi:hypothetical protein